MQTQDYVSYIKELILHHCLRCGILSESSTCDICKMEIGGHPVMIKVEVKISTSDIEAGIADVHGDFTHIKPGRLQWAPSRLHYFHKSPDTDLIQLERRLKYEVGDVD